MPTHRKFNAEKFISSFRGHELELRALFAQQGVETPSTFELQSVHSILMHASGDRVDRLVASLHELNDLSSRVGREMIEQTCRAAGIEPPGEDVPNERAACWLHVHNPQLFEHAIELLAVRSVRGSRVALFPGRCPQPIADAGAVADKMRDLMKEPLRALKKSENVHVRHYFDGDMFVTIVFCERTAEVQMEFGGPGATLVSRVRRPADQYVILYNQKSGDLEIEAGRPKERELLRSTFAHAAFDDVSFFPATEAACVLSLDRLVETGFNLPTRPGHTARITALKLAGSHNRRKVCCDYRAGRNDLIDFLEQRHILGAAMDGMSIESARIELVIEPTRAGRKTIEVTGANGIKFNRESHADVVYDYLRNWRLMRDDLADQSAA